MTKKVWIVKDETWRGNGNAWQSDNYGILTMHIDNLVEALHRVSQNPFAFRHMFISESTTHEHCMP